VSHTECPYNCQTCEDNGHEVMTCSQCMNAFVLNGMDCGNCPPFCLECVVKYSKGLECTKCENGTVQLADGSCQRKCQYFNLLAPLSCRLFLCTECSANCVQCDETKCLVCDAEYAVDVNGNCQSECLPHGNRIQTKHSLTSFLIQNAALSSSPTA
jgi:hypothetical protein